MIGKFISTNINSLKIIKKTKNNYCLTLVVSLITNVKSL